MSSSQFLNAKQIRGLNRLGDVYFPGDAEMPSFSAIGVVEHVDAALQALPEEDRQGLATLLGVMGVLPMPITRGIVRMAEWGPRVPGPVGMGLRFLKLGMKGVIASLYYSGETGSGYRGPSPLDVLGYRVGVYTADVDERERTSASDHGSVAACRDL